jgi:hypothetical protein
MTPSPLPTSESASFTTNTTETAASTTTTATAAAGHIGLYVNGGMGPDRFYGHVSTLSVGAPGGGKQGYCLCGGMTTTTTVAMTAWEIVIAGAPSHAVHHRVVKYFTN